MADQARNHIPALKLGAKIITDDIADDAVTEDKISAEILAAVNLVQAIPTVDPEVSGVIWNDSGTLKASAGA